MQETKLTNEEIADIRARVSELQKKHKYTRAKIALDAGLANSTFSQFMSDKYDGDIVRPALLLKKWLQNHAENEALIKRIGQENNYVKTSVGDRMWQVMRYCLVASDMGAIMGKPGMSKTQTAKAFCQQNALAHYMTIAPSGGDVSPMLSCLVEALKRDCYVQRARQMRAVIDDTLSPSHIVLVDEAQHLTGRSLEELRAIHDVTGCGLVLMGNLTVVTRLSGPARAAQFAQLTSRIGMKYSTPEVPAEADVRAIASSLYDFGEPELQYLVQISKRHGALRSVVKTIKLGRMLTPGGKAKTTLQHLKDARSQLS